MTAYRETLGAQQPRGEDEVHHLPYHGGVLGRPGFLHGGAIAGLLALACDWRAEADGGRHCPVTSSMNFLRGGRERDSFASAEIRARTSRLLVIEATAWQESPDKPIATMTRTYMRRS